MYGRRTFANHYRRYFFFAVMVASVAGYCLLPVIPYHFDPTRTHLEITISTQGHFSSPLEMARNVTIPLEEQLGRVSGIAGIRSSSSADQSLIFLRLHTSVGNELTNEILAILRRISKTLPSHASRPVLNPANKQESPLELVCWIPDSSRSARMHLSLIRESLARLPGTTGTGHSALRLMAAEPGLVVAGNSRYLHRLQGDAVITKTSSTLFGHRTDPLLTTSFPSLRSEQECLVNGYPGLVLTLYADSNRNVWWWKNSVVRAMESLASETGLCFMFPDDPWMSGQASWNRYGIVAFVAICILLFVRKSTLSVLAIPLLFPGVFLLMLYFLDVRSVPVTVDILFVSWVILALKLMCSKDVFLREILTAIILAILAFICTGLEVTRPHLLDVFTASGTGLLSLAFCLMPLCSYRGFVGSTVKRIPWPALLICIFTTGMVVSEASGLVDSGAAKIFLQGKAPDRHAWHGPSSEIILRGRGHSFLHDLDENACDSVMNLLAVSSPDLVFHRKHGEEHVIRARWTKASQSDMLNVRSLIRPLLFFHSGIRWVMEGAGETFQNDALLMPGRYHVDLTGPDYHKLLGLARRTGDSLNTLPGVGETEVNTSAVSGQAYYEIAKGTFRNNHQEIFSGFRYSGVPDSMKFLHHVFFSGSGQSNVRSPVNITRKKSPAPVKRVQNKFVIPLTWEHYGGAKYAGKFYRRIRMHLQQFLPSGYRLLPLQTMSSNSLWKIPVLLFLMIAVSMPVIAINISVRVINTVSLAYLLAAICLLQQGWRVSAPVTESLITLTLFLVILSVQTGRSRIGMLTGWFAVRFFMYPPGNDLFLMEACAGLSGIYLLPRTKDLIAGGRKGLKQLLDLIGFGVIAKLIK